MSNVWFIPDSKHNGSKCSLHSAEKDVGLDHYCSCESDFRAHNRPYLGSAGNTCNLTPSLVVLLHPAAKHLVGIAEKCKKMYFACLFTLRIAGKVCLD